MEALPTVEEVITAKANCFKAGIFDVLDLFGKQVDALENLHQREIKELLFGGAAGGGKSWIGCEWLLWSCLAYPGTRWFIGRRQKTEIRKSTIVTFAKVCRKHGIPEIYWRYNDNSVTITFANGSVIEGLELAHKPGDKDYDTFGSTEYTGGWIEEGGGVPVKAYEILTVRVGRHMNDQYGIEGKILITCNPSRNWLYKLFYQPWKAKTLAPFRRFIRSFVTDNTKRESGYMERLETLKGETRARLLLGDWEFDDDPLSLIEYSAIVDLFTNDYIVPDITKKRLICDVAMYGSDLFRVGAFYGDVLVEHRYMLKSGGKEVLGLVKGMQAAHQIRAHGVLYDADGVGAFLGGSGGFIPGAVAFHGNAAPFKTQRDPLTDYANLKSQCGYLLAEKINDGLCWAKAVVNETDKEMLSEELAHIKKSKGASDDKLRLKRKELIVADLGRSPDFSDLFLMNQYFDLRGATKRPARERPLSSY